MSKHIGVRLAVVAGVALACAGTATAAGGGPKATGGVKFTTVNGGDGKADFNARPTDTGAAGNVHVVVTRTANVADFKGDVTCYFQDGNLARFSGPITKGDATVDGEDATAFRITVVDNGSPGDGNDLIRVSKTMGVRPCTRDTDAPSPILKGNIQVHQP